ncbi:hypothetical protein ACSHWI_15950 [Methylococcus sp. S2T]
MERYERDPNLHTQPTQEALADLIAIAEDLCQVKTRTGMAQPSVMT